MSHNKCAQFNLNAFAEKMHMTHKGMILVRQQYQLLTSIKIHEENAINALDLFCLRLMSLYSLRINFFRLKLRTSGYVEYIGCPLLSTKGPDWKPCGLKTICGLKTMEKIDLGHNPN